MAGLSLSNKSEIIVSWYMCCIKLNNIIFYYMNSNETDTLIKIIRKYFLNVYKMIFVLDQV